MGLNHLTIAILVDNIYQDQELWYPYFRLQEAGVNVVIVGKEKQTYLSKYGFPADAQIAIADARKEDFDGVIVPGGYCPDKLRTYPEILKFVKNMDGAGKLVAAICHGPWVLISAGLAKGRNMTCYAGIKDDLKNAGALYEDKPVVVFDNMITSRKPQDLPVFCIEILKFLEKTWALDKNPQKGSCLEG